MKNTELFDLLKTLNETEFHDFGEYLVIFAKVGEEENMMKLFRMLEKSFTKVHFQWDKWSLEKAQVHLEIFQKSLETKKDNTNLRNLIHRLHKQLRNYCRFLQFHKKPEESDYLLEYLSERGAYEIFEREYRNCTKNQQYGVKAMKQKHEVFEIKIDAFIKNQARKQQPDYQQTFELFEDFVLVKKMQLYCTMLNRKLIGRFEFEEGFEEKIEGIFVVAQGRKSINLLASVYKVCSQMLQGKEEQYYELKKILLQNAAVLDKKDLKLCYIFMSTFCYHIGKQFFKEARQDYLYRFDNKLLYEGDFIPLMHAKNVCTAIFQETAAVKIDGWSQDFAEKKIRKVVKETPPTYRKSSLQFHLGVLAFYFQDYSKTIEILKKKRNYANPNFDFDGRTILLRAYYLLKDIELIDDFEKEVRNCHNALKNARTLSEDYKAEYHNFATAIKQLYEIRLIYDRKTKKTKIEKLQNFLNHHKLKKKEWFVKQLGLM